MYETFYTNLKYYFKIQSLATLCLVLNSQAGDIVSAIVAYSVANFPNQQSHKIHFYLPALDRRCLNEPVNGVIRKF